jgi:hypothetical protein
MGGLYPFTGERACRIAERMSLDVRSLELALR